MTTMMLMMMTLALLIIVMKPTAVYESMIACVAVNLQRSREVIYRRRFSLHDSIIKPEAVTDSGLIMISQRHQMDFVVCLER